jgi:hypothetical protein
MAQQVTPLDGALQLFAPVEEATLSNAKPIVKLALPQEPDRKQKRELQKLLLPLVFLFRGRDDVVRQSMQPPETMRGRLTVVVHCRH